MNIVIITIWETVLSVYSNVPGFFFLNEASWDSASDEEIPISQARGLVTVPDRLPSGKGYKDTKREGIRGITTPVLVHVGPVYHVLWFRRDIQRTVNKTYTGGCRRLWSVSPNERLHRVSFWFQKMDLNHDGVISVEEFMDTCRRVCIEYNCIVWSFFFSFFLSLPSTDMVSRWAINSSFFLTNLQSNHHVFYCPDWMRDHFSLNPAFKSL